jgi:hypothetical protein
VIENQSDDYVDKTDSRNGSLETSLIGACE